MTEAEAEADLRELLSDTLIHRIPGEWPRAFMRLPWSEQRWRGRAFLVTYILTGGDGSGGRIAFAWSVALNADPEVAASNRAAIEEIPDDAIAEGLG